MSPQSNPFDHCLNFAAGALSRAITQLAEAAFGEVGLSPSHAYLLIQVSDRPGIPLGRVAEVMMLDASTLTRLIEKLETKGWVERRANGRSRQLYLTPAGASRVPVVRQAWADLEAQYIAILGEDHARVITQLSLATARRIGEKLSASST
jgi:DNA-binding MarR family transcriptional regulator